MCSQRVNWKIFYRLQFKILTAMSNRTFWCRKINSETCFTAEVSSSKYPIPSKKNYSKPYVTSSIVPPIFAAPNVLPLFLQVTNILAPSISTLSVTNYLKFLRYKQNVPNRSKISENWVEVEIEKQQKTWTKKNAVIKFIQKSWSFIIAEVELLDGSFFVEI